MSLYDLRHAADAPSLRFLAAQKGFTIQEAARHCCALANQGGGKLIFGLSPDRPRKVIGSHVFEPYEPVRYILQEQLHVRIVARTYREEKKRVLVFLVAGRPTGVPIQVGGICWKYAGDSLVPLSPEDLQRIEAEGEPDFTATICKGATWEDLDMDAVSKFLALRQENCGDSVLGYLSREEVLAECGAITDEGITYAALILFGKGESLEKFLPACATIFDFRYYETDFPSKEHRFIRRGLFTYYGEMTSHLFTGDRQCDHVDGFDMVRDGALGLDSTVQLFLNAVCHRDYQRDGHIEIRMNWKAFTIQSPGGFPEGITADNLKTRQHPRNRLLAKLLTLSGLTRYSGHGMDVVYSSCLRNARSLPDFTGTDDTTVVCTLRSAVSDEKLPLTMYRLDHETLNALPYEAIQVLCILYHRESIPEPLEDYVGLLLERNVISKSNGYYTFVRPTMIRPHAPPTLEEAIMDVLSQAEQGLSATAIRKALTCRWEDAVQKALEEMEISGSVCCLTEKRYSHLWFAR